MRVNGCCCCCSLRTGTLVLGVLALIGACSSVLSGVQYLMGSDAAVRAQVDQIEKMIGHCDQDCEDMIYSYMRSSVWSNFIQGIILIVICSLLIHGVRKGKPSLLIPFMVYIILFLIALGLFLIGSIVVAIMVSATVGIVLFIVIGLFFALELYFFFVVNSYRHELMEDQNRSTVGMMEGGTEMGRPPPYKD